MATQTTPRTHLTITLTGRAPVRIQLADWPVIAQATGDSYGAGDYSRHQQALGCGELDRYSLRVRRHADGRAVVYSILDAASAWTGSEDHRGGELLAAGEDLAAAITRAGEECGLPASIIRGAIADLPAEVLR